MGDLFLMTYGKVYGLCRVIVMCVIQSPCDNMLRKLLIMISFVCNIGLSAQVLSNVHIIPQPREMSVAHGTFRITRETFVVTGQKELLSVADYFCKYTTDLLGLSLSARKVKSKEIDSIRKAIVLQNLNNGRVSGGYQLEVTNEGIVIKGNDAAGVFYGVQTLIQLLPVKAGVLADIPLVTIHDEPRFAYRGMHLDVVRHFFPIAYIKRYIDYMALHKMNYFHWHLTDDQGWRIEMKSYPKLTQIGAYRKGEIEGIYPGVYKELPYGGFYTQEEIKEVIAYAAERFITIIPEIDIPGHCMSVLAAYPEFGTVNDASKECALTWGIYNKFNNVLAPKPEVFSFLKGVFSELCSLFPSPYIHVGGDECAVRWWKESEETQSFMRAHRLKNEKELHRYFIQYVQEVVNAKGKTLVGWDEILEGGVSADCVVMNWRKSAQAVKALKNGHQVIVTPSAYTYLNIKESRRQKELGFPGFLPLEKVYDLPILPDSLSDEQKSRVLGGQGCMWTEYVSTPAELEFALFPRMSALAERLWSFDKDWVRFTQKLQTQFDRYDLWGANYSEAVFRMLDLEHPYR